MNTATLREHIKSHRFFVGEQATNGQPIVLTHQRIFILPTARGLGFVLLNLLLLLIAFVYNNNLAYLLAFLIASVFFITILHSFKSLSGLAVQVGQAHPVFAGNPANFDVYLENPSNTPRQHVQVILNLPTHVDLPAHSRSTVTLSCSTQRRGWFEPGKITIASSYPLGLFRPWSPLRFNLKVLVYPKPAALASPFPESAAGMMLHGHSQKGRDEFYGIQEYQPGDSVRQIHWRSFAKGLGLNSKQFAGGNASEVWLDFAQTSGHDLEQRLSQLCRWVLDADQAGVRYGFILPGMRLKPDSGPQHTRQCLEALALF